MITLEEFVANVPPVRDDKPVPSTTLTNRDLGILAETRSFVTPESAAEALELYNTAKRLESAARMMMAKVKTFAETSPDPIVNEEGQLYTRVEATAIYVIGIGRMSSAQQEAADKLGMLDVRDASSWRFMKAGGL